MHRAPVLCQSVGSTKNTAVAETVTSLVLLELLRAKGRWRMVNKGADEVARYSVKWYVQGSEREKRLWLVIEAGIS